MTTDDIHNLMTELMKMLTIYPDEKTDYPPIHSPIYLPTFFLYRFSTNLIQFKLRVSLMQVHFKQSMSYMWAYTAFTSEQSSFFVLLFFIFIYFKLEFLYHWIGINETNFIKMFYGWDIVYRISSFPFTMVHSELFFLYLQMIFTASLNSKTSLSFVNSQWVFQYSNEAFHSYLFRSNSTIDWQRIDRR